MSAQDLPGATTRIDPTSGPVGTGTKLCVVIACVPTNDDGVPRFYANPASVYANHGYGPGVDYSAIHMAETKKPVLFVPVPIATQGVIGRVNQSGNTNTSVVSAATGADGSLEECDVVVTVEKGGVVGTDSIQIGLSLDGGRSSRSVKIGQASSYTIPYVGHVLSFGAGSLTAGQVVLEYHSTAPMWDQAGIQSARTGLKNQFKQARSWLVVGDLPSSTEAGYVTTEVNAYETSDNRFCQARCSLRDRLPYAQLSQSRVRMLGAPNITFAEVGAGGDTATRASGSFISDGFANGDTVRITGAVAGTGHNNITGVATVTSATVLTFASSSVDFDDEGPIAGVSMTSEMTLTFGDNGASPDTIDRNSGSWLDDGFRVGDSVTITGTGSNNVSNKVITVLTATTMTFATGTLNANEVIGHFGVTMTAGQTKAAHIAALDAAFSTVTSQRRIELSAGRGFKLSPFLGAELRRPSSWADNLRAYQHDVHIPTWKKELGALDGWSLEDKEGNLVEFDERIDGGALAAGFTCLRSWASGPGTYIAKSLTRAGDDSVLTQSWAMAVVNVAQTSVQADTENAVGVDLVLNADNTATGESLNAIKKRVDSGLKRNVLADVENEGKRASLASWDPHTDDDLSGANATLNAVLNLTLKGVLVQINTLIKVNAGA